jgi:hypothetical protein
MQIHFPRGGERYPCWCSDPDMVTFDDFIRRHESVEEGVFW